MLIISFKSFQAGFKNYQASLKGCKAGFKSCEASLKCREANFKVRQTKTIADCTLVYFTAHSGNLANELSKVEAAGGKVLQPKKLIAPDIGYMALFADTEGNRLALHSRQ